ncbi:MAG: SseB family protein [Lachnospiraceae bacterium]|nr:SseB family protein [Lachnospiraceae bacterium]
MKQNKPITNPMLLGTIELMKDSNTPEHRKMFLDELLCAHFLAPVVITPPPMPDENGQVQLSPESKVQFPMLATKDGAHFFMAFTDWTELRKWKDENGQQTMALRFDDYAGMLLSKDKEGKTSPALGFVLNPYGANIVITKEMIAKVLANRAAKSGKQIPPSVTQNNKEVK